MYKNLLYLCFCIHFMMNAQENLTGQVYFDQNKPVMQASVFWEGTTLGTVTDNDGKFSIKKTVLSQTLVISYVGFKTQKIEVTNQNNLKVVLAWDTSLDGVVIEQARKALQKNRLSVTNLHQMNKAEFTKAACCNLSESFETNPSIDVNFSDAISGTRQIRMLGLTSPYIAMTEENILTMRGASQFAGLSFIPGTWAHSIQITKGAGSVINGFESISGQINYEFLKPHEEPELFFNGFAGMGGRYELNTHVNHEFNESWATGFFIHGSTRTERFDNNNDGFLDNPLGNQINLLNKWQYGHCGSNGFTGEMNLRLFRDSKQSGQLDFNPNLHRFSTDFFGSDINSNMFSANLKVGYVFPEQSYKSFGFQNQYSDFSQDSYFGLRTFEVRHQSWYSNLLFASIINNTLHKFTTGVSFQWDRFEEFYNQADFSRTDRSVGTFFEYSYNNDEDISYTLGGRADYHNRLGFFVTPRAHFRYLPFENTTLRLSAGQGRRVSNVFMEQQQLFASNRAFVLPNQSDANRGFYGLDPEIAWNYGLGFIQKFTLFNRSADFSVDLYKTDFLNQVVVDLDASTSQVQLYNLNGKSFANSLQVDFNMEVIDKLDLRTSYKYFDIKVDNSIGLQQRILQPNHRLFANLAYETSLNKKDQKWKFDTTFNWLGSQRLPNSSENPSNFQWVNRAPAFYTVNAQITKVFKNFELYVGGENLNNYQQPNAIIQAENPFGAFFDSSLVYGPVFGAMYYTGFRWTIN